MSRRSSRLSGSDQTDEDEDGNVSRIWYKDSPGRYNKRRDQTDEDCNVSRIWYKDSPGRYNKRRDQTDEDGNVSRIWYKDSPGRYNKRRDQTDEDGNVSRIWYKDSPGRYNKRRDQTDEDGNVSRIWYKDSPGAGAFSVRKAILLLLLLTFGVWLTIQTQNPSTFVITLPSKETGHHVLQSGKCWAFHGAQGSLVIALFHPVLISHVTLDHLPRFTSPTGHIDSGPKDFQVYGMSTEGEEGRLLGTFIYDQAGESIQTFKLPDRNGTPYRYVELAILSNWGHLEYTCVYRFLVHGQIASL